MTDFESLKSSKAYKELEAQISKNEKVLFAAKPSLGALIIANILRPLSP